MTREMTTVDFHGKELQAHATEDGTVYVVMKPVCEHLGIDWEKQREKIRRDTVLNDVATIRGVETNVGIREVLCLPLKYLNGWLFGISEYKVKSSVKPLLIKYKKECYDALSDYFNKGLAINKEFVKDSKLIAELESIRESLISDRIKDTVILEVAKNRSKDILAKTQNINSISIISSILCYVEKYNTITPKQLSVVNKTYKAEVIDKLKK